MNRAMIQTLVLTLILFLSDSYMVDAFVEDNYYKHCEHVVKKWAYSSVDSEVKNDKHVLRDLLFFLHIPRTGGRTYLHCFLKKLYSNSQECPRSYDKLRFNPGKQKCRLISTHDDYSVISKFPKKKTSVLTILRNPLDRVFSTYEFSVEVAARFLIHPNLTSVAKSSQMALRARQKTSTVSTLDIWPWKYLVPWMRQDLFARRDSRRLKGLPNLTTNNSYDMDNFVMPLHDYINDPISRDIIHNGATFQIAGLTNNSYFANSHEVRHCVVKYNSLGEYVLEVAKKRLDEMLYVGLTENHKESATIFANVVGAQVISMHINSTVSSHEDQQQNSSIDDLGNSTDMIPNTEKMTVGKLIKAYEGCSSSLRNAQSKRRVNSLKQVSPVNFTKEARKMVSEELIREIESLNSLDIKLYKYAQIIFTKHHDSIKDVIVTEELASTIMTNTQEYDLLYDASSWFICIGVFSSLILIGLYVNSLRKASKLKL